MIIYHAFQNREYHGPKCGKSSTSSNLSANTHLFEQEQLIIVAPLLIFIHFLNKPGAHIRGIIGELTKLVKRF